MEYILHFLLLLVLGGCGALLAHKLKLPTGIFLGPIFFVGTYQILFGRIIDKPHWLRLVVQIAVGIVLGTRFTKDFFTNFKKMIPPTITACVSLFSGAMLLGFLLKTFTGWDMATSILSTAPGGQAEMALLSDSVGAQTENVIVLQLIRNQIALVVMLPLARYFLKDKINEVKGK